MLNTNLENATFGGKPNYYTGAVTVAVVYEYVGLLSTGTTTNTCRHEYGQDNEGSEKAGRHVESWNERVVAE